MSAEPISKGLAQVAGSGGEEPQPAVAQAEQAPDWGHYSAYEEHAKTLRAWLVAYGIGGPVLIVTQEPVWRKLASSGHLRTTAVLFLLGVALQVLLAALNKSAMWACYFGELEPDFKRRRRYRFAHWLAERYSIDLICDLSAICLFGAATYLAFDALVT